MRKVVLTLKEQEKYTVIKKLVETDGNKLRAARKLRISTRQVNRLISGYKEFGKEFFALEEISEFQKHSLNFDDIVPEEPKRIYIPRMAHPFKRESFEIFMAKQYAKLEKSLVQT